VYLGGASLIVSLDTIYQLTWCTNVEDFSAGIHIGEESGHTLN